LTTTAFYDTTAEEKMVRKFPDHQRKTENAMALIGYARVSRNEQHLELQLDRLREKGCPQIFTDKITGATFERKELEEALAYLREGDTLVVWKLDRLGRSLRHLIDTVTKLQERNIGFISLTESIDTTTPGGVLIFHIMGALAQFERDLIRERTNAGLEAARARGRKGGRPATLHASRKVAMAQKLYADKSNEIKDICKTLHISHSTLYRYVNVGKQEV
jgi:DNA invertase Pin-like site-specific DNA recombinase